jgi:hypothetical protein
VVFYGIRWYLLLRSDHDTLTEEVLSRMLATASRAVRDPVSPDPQLCRPNRLKTGHTS